MSFDLDAANAKLAHARVQYLLDAEVRAIDGLVAEVERLRAEVADLRMQRDEHLIDNMHAYEEGVAEGECRERAAVVAWLRGEPERLVECDGRRHADGKSCLVMSPMPADELADCVERGDHRREEEE